MTQCHEVCSHLSVVTGADVRNLCVTASAGAVWKLDESGLLSQLPAAAPQLHALQPISVNENAFSTIIMVSRKHLLQWCSHVTTTRSELDIDLVKACQYCKFNCKPLYCYSKILYHTQQVSHAAEQMLMCMHARHGPEAAEDWMHANKCNFHEN